jgi:hypothetical protein
MEDPGNDCSGRAKHLARLAAVFRHRHGTWGDFGLFLKMIFGEVLPVGRVETAPLEKISCRHNSGGRHHQILQASRIAPGDYPMFTHERYTRPCVTLGSFDRNKNPGLVVSDLCIKARAFLLSIGKGDENDPTGRDREYVPPSDDLEMSSPYNPAEADPDSRELSPVSEVGGYLRSLPRVRQTQGSSSYSAPMELDAPTPGESRPVEDGSSSYGGSLFEEEDVLEMINSWMAPAEQSQQTVETMSDVGSIESLPQRAGRLSTKMRVATLAYLWKFADNAEQLRAEFRRLRRDNSLQVLHLCGCGLCIITEQGEKIPGCCEKTHLMLGTAVMNGHHKNYHTTIGLSQVEDYPALCGILHRARNGDGIF